METKKDIKKIEEVDSGESAKLKAELQDKKNQLKQNTRLLEGFEGDMNDKKVLSCDKQIDRLNKFIRMKEIEITRDNGLGGIRYGYENNREWKSIVNTFKQEEIEDLRKGISRVEKQKKIMEEGLPELKTRIKELEKKLNIKKKPDYVG